jgi:hypothetical protein
MPVTRTSKRNKISFRRTNQWCVTQHSQQNVSKLFGMLTFMIKYHSNDKNIGFTFIQNVEPNDTIFNNINECHS